MSASLAPSELVTATAAVSPVMLKRGARPGHRDRVRLAGGQADRDGVGLPVAGRAADRAGEIDVDLGGVGAREVVQDDAVGAAERVDGERLEVVHVHHDGADVARQQRARAVGRQLVDLVGGAAVEQQRVGARLALDDVAAVAGIPVEDVVARAEEGDVVALLPVDEVVALAAEQRVAAVAREDRVVARTAVERQADQRGQIAAWC